MKHTYDTALIHELGMAIGNHRRAKGLSQLDVAKAAGMSLNRYIALERGSGGRLHNFIRVMLAFDTLRARFIPDAGRLHLKACELLSVNPVTVREEPTDSQESTTRPASEWDRPGPWCSHCITNNAPTENLPGAKRCQVCGAPCVQDKPVRSCNVVLDADGRTHTTDRCTLRVGCALLAGHKGWCRDRQGPLS